MTYIAWSVVFGEQPSAAKWNILGANDASFHDGTGIANGAITADKLFAGPRTALVSTSQTTTSTSYTDLATVGPAVTVTIGANGQALVCLAVEGASSAASGQGWLMGFAVSGASTVAAADTNAMGVINQDLVNNLIQFGVPYLVTGLTPGSNIFTAKYKASGSTTATFVNRNIAVIPL